jgi:hypothetical protein
VLNSTAIRKIHQGRDHGPDLSNQVCTGDELSLPRDAIATGAGDLLAAHQRGEVHVPLVGRRIGAVVVTELAVEAELVDLVEALLGDAFDLAFGGVDQIEQAREGGAQGQAAATLVAHLAGAPQLAFE